MISAKPLKIPRAKISNSSNKILIYKSHMRNNRLLVLMSQQSVKSYLNNKKMANLLGLLSPTFLKSYMESMTTLFVLRVWYHLLKAVEREGGNRYVKATK